MGRKLIHFLPEIGETDARHSMTLTYPNYRYTYMTQKCSNKRLLTKLQLNVNEPGKCNTSK